MPRVIHFELPVEDPDRAGAFYREVFDWQIRRWDGPEDYWLVVTGPPEMPGINGGLLRRPGGCVNTIDVPSVDEFVQKITAHGGEVAVPRMAVPGVGYLAYCKDTEGNLFGILEPDATAQ